MKISRILAIGVVCMVQPIASFTCSAQAPKSYYLTKTRFAATQAKTACTKGYHMASIFEIEDTTALHYQTTLGNIAGDSGGGPPLGIESWARTGLPGLNQSCNAWTSDEPDLQGYTFMLVFPSNNANRQMFGHWAAQLESCSAKLYVACVQD